jgi:hypothetical protein
MCNLYSPTKGQAAIRDWFRARHDRTGNLPQRTPDEGLPQVQPSKTSGAPVNLEGQAQATVRLSLLSSAT